MISYSLKFYIILQLFSLSLSLSKHFAVSSLIFHFLIVLPYTFFFSGFHPIHFFFSGFHFPFSSKLSPFPVFLETLPFSRFLSTYTLVHHPTSPSLSLLSPPLLPPPSLHICHLQRTSRRSNPKQGEVTRVDCEVIIQKTGGREGVTLIIYATPIKTFCRQFHSSPFADLKLLRDSCVRFL